MIAMQGAWRISVKSVEAFSTTQKFIVSGANTGNGTYDGNLATAPVDVTGDAWSISVQHDSGAGFVDSFDQIVFPSRSGGRDHFDIQANDDAVDPVFDDLVLTCSIPVTFDDFLVYGNVSWYDCWYNPCSPRTHLLIDSVASLATALQRPALKDAITQLYPARVFPPRPNPPDPGPFRPMLVPVENNAAVPVKQVQVIDTATNQATVRAANNVSGTLAAASTSLSKVSISANALAPIHDLVRFCQTGPLPQYVLRFFEYDRTADELASGPYTGTGARRPLGTTATDRNGNYVFRFGMSFGDFLDEAFNDTAAGENVLVQIMPDVIVQVMDGSNVIYETAPYWNIPNFKRINICVPKGLVHLPPGCREGQIIQSIGNITMGPLVGGQRTTASTFLGTTGEITSYSSLGPLVRCAAWAGSLYLYACLNEPSIRYYTISYKRPGTADSSAQFVHDTYSPPHVAPAPVYWVETPVGATTRNLVIDGVARSVSSYFNIETDPADGWMDRWKLLKAQISSRTCEDVLGGPGPIEFRLIGYTPAGAPPGADGVMVTDDRITLYVDNSAIDQYIDPTVKMGLQTQGDCALLTADPPNAPLEVTFRANHNEGFLDTYTLYMYKGAGHAFPIERVSGGLITGSYTHVDNLACSSFVGTRNDPAYGSPVANAVTTDVRPSGGGNWLSDTETFCAFSINLSASYRVTDGQTILSSTYSGPILIGIQKPKPGV